MAIRFKMLSPALVGCLIALPVLADETINLPKSYISFSVGKSGSPGTCATTYAPGASCSDTSHIYRLGYGYQFTPTWGMQISYGDFGQAHEQGIDAAPPPSVPGGGPIPYTWSWQAEGWEIAGTGTLHFGQSLSLIGKLGYLHANVGQEYIWTSQANGLWHTVSHETSNNVSSSIGAQYDFNRDFALRLQYDKYGKLGSLSKINVSAILASFILKF